MFRTVKWLACFVASNVNVSSDASLGSCGRVPHYYLSVITHPTRCETSILEHFCECVQELKIVVW